MTAALRISSSGVLPNSTLDLEYDQGCITRKARIEHHALTETHTIILILPGIKT